MCFLSVLAQAQEAFHQVFQSYSESRVYSAPHPDGGLVFASSTVGFTGNNLKKLQVFRVGANDSVLWSKFIQVDGNIEATDIKVSAVGHIVILARLTKFGAEPTYFFTVHSYDADGNEQWKKQFSGGFDDYAYNLHISPQNDIIVFGNTYLQNNNDCRVFILKMNMAGAMFSSKTYMTTSVWGSSALTSDGHMIIRNSGNVFKVKPNGNVAWHRQIVFTTGYSYRIKEDSDGNYIFLTFRQESWFLVKIDADDGEIIWVSDALKMKDPLLNPGISLADFIPDGNGGYIAVGHTWNGDKQSGKVALAVRWNSNGKFTGSTAYLASSDDTQGEFLNIHRIANNIYELTGNAGSDFRKTLRIKTGNNLQSDCNYEPELDTIKGLFEFYNGGTVPVANRTFTVEDFFGNGPDFEVWQKKGCEICDSPAVAIAGETVLCNTDTLTLSTEGSNGSYHWSTGDTTFTIKVHKPGTYWVRVQNVCGEATDTITITEGTLPQPNFTISPTETEPDKFVNFSDNSQNVHQRLWHTGDGFTTDTANFSHSYTQNGTYPAKLELTSPTGCTWDTTVIITISYHSWFLPNAFTPNNDGLNEVFEVKGYGILKYELQVYNRWGERVFDGTNQGWNGFYKGKQVQPGLYKYRLYLQYDNYRVVNQSGDVYVVE